MESAKLPLVSTARLGSVRQKRLPSRKCPTKDTTTQPDPIFYGNKKMLKVLKKLNLIPRLEILQLDLRSLSVLLDSPTKRIYQR